MANNVYEGLQKAIVTAFKANTWLVSNTSGLFFCQTLKKTNYPYGVFYLNADAINTLDGSINSVDFQINFFDNSASSEKINDIMMNLISVYDRKTLSLTGFSTSKLMQNNSRIIRIETDTWQLTLSFSVIVQ